MSLTAHYDTKRTSEEEIIAVPEPQWTDTWHPISHARCLDVLTFAVKQFNLQVEKKEYSLSKDGFKCFGSWTITGATVEQKEISQSIVFRNSLNKEFAFGIAAGSHAWVCDNLAFTGEFVEFRRHTKGMEDSELERVVNNGMEIILPRMKAFQDWHQQLHEIKFTDSRMKELCYDAVVKEIIPRRQVNEFNNLLFGTEFGTIVPQYRDNELFGFHGACTQLYRDKSMVNTGERQKALFNFIQDKYGELLPSLN